MDKDIKEIKFKDLCEFDDILNILEGDKNGKI